MSCLPAAAAAASIESAFGEIEGDRLFDQDVLAGLERLDGHPAMGVVGDAEVDEVDLGIGQEGLEVAVTGRRRKDPSECRAARNCPGCSSSRRPAFLGSRLHRATTRAPAALAAAR